MIYGVPAEVAPAVAVALPFSAVVGGALADGFAVADLTIMLILIYVCAVCVCVSTVVNHLAADLAISATLMMTVAAADIAASEQTALLQTMVMVS